MKKMSFEFLLGCGEYSIASLPLSLSLSRMECRHSQRYTTIGISIHIDIPTHPRHHQSTTMHRIMRRTMMIISKAVFLLFWFILVVVMVGVSTTRGAPLLWQPVTTPGPTSVGTTSSILAMRRRHIQQQQQPNTISRTTIRINCGATQRYHPVMTQPNNITWHRDAHYQSGQISNRCARSNVVVGGNQSSSIYCTSRYFRSASYGTPLRYDIPVPTNNASYSVRLHFNEQVTYEISIDRDTM